MGANYNFYNRVSSRRLLSKDQIPHRAKSADKITDQGKEGNPDDIYGDDDTFYGWNNWGLSNMDEEITREEVYEDIYNRVEIYPELKDAIEKFCDSAITPDDTGKYFSFAVDETLDSYDKKLIEEAHDRIVTLLGFDNHMEAWKAFYEWSVFGRIALIQKFEFKTKKELEDEKNKVREKLGLVEVKLKEAKESLVKLKETKDSKSKAQSTKVQKLAETVQNQKNRKEWLDNISKFEPVKTNADGDELIAVDIKEIKKINFLELTKQIDRDNRKVYWEYRGEVYSNNEIIVIDYNSISGNHLPLKTRNSTLRPYKKISYAHKLLRNYNILNRIELTSVSWTILNAMYRQVTTVPITTKVTSKAKEALSKVRNKYLDNFTVDHDGVIRLNGDTTFNAMKHIALADRGGNKPTVETVEFNGFDMSDMKVVNYFRYRFMDDTRLPYSRFDKEGQSGGLSLYKADGVPFTEVSFYNFLDRCLHQFAVLMKKPTQTLVNIKDPKTTITIQNMESKMRYSWEAMNYYHEARRAEKETKILSDIETMMRFQDKEGDTIFPAKYLFVNKYKLYTDNQWDELEKMKLVDKVDGNKEEEITAGGGSPDDENEF